MHERKVEMAKRAEAFVGLPGGFGTFEEVRTLNALYMTTPELIAGYQGARSNDLVSAWDS